MAIKTKILLPRSSFADWEQSPRVLQEGELVLAYDGTGKFRLFEGNNATFGQNASGVKELLLDARQVVLSGDAEVTLQAAIDDLREQAGDALTAVSGSGTGVVTGLTQTGQTVEATFTNISGTQAASGDFNVITSITQDATGKITSVAGISALTEHQSLADYYTQDEVDQIVAGLSVEDSAATSQFVTAVSQTDGVVSVTRAQPALSDLVDSGDIALKGDASTAVSSDQTVAGAKAYADAALAGELEDYYRKSETSSAEELSDAFDGKQDAGDYLSSNALEGYALVGTNEDLSSADTVYGAKAYADARVAEVTAGELTAYYKKNETSSSEEISVALDQLSSVLSAVSGSGTGVVTGLTKDGQTISATFANLAGTKTADAGYALAGVTQDATGQITAFTQISVLNAADVKIGYSTDEKKIFLSAGENVTNIDASDFIKDGMLSAAAYDSATHQIILTFNADGMPEPISVDVGDLVDTYTVADTGTIDMEMSNNQISASIVSGSITPDLLSATAEWIFDCNL